MFIRKKKLMVMLKEATENGIRMGILIKRGGIYGGKPLIVREAERILRGVKKW